MLTSLKRPHLEYFSDFYADTALFGGGQYAIRCGLEFFGADKVVFASDAPLGPIAETIAKVESLDLPESDLHKIFHGNAERLLRSSDNGR